MKKESTNKIQKLLEKHDYFRDEVSRYEKLIIVLNAKEAELLVSCDLEVAAEFKKISEVRLARELAPKKIDSFENSLRSVEADLAAECGKTIAQLAEDLADKISKVKSTLSAVLSPFFNNDVVFATESERVVYQHFNATLDATGAAEMIAYGTKEGQPLYDMVERLKNDNFLRAPAIAQARELLKLIEKSAKLSV